MSAETLRVLVVDDSALFRTAIVSILKSFPDVEVVGLATNGREAIERIRDLQPDLLTLDVEMPVLNGIETLREMRRSGLKTPTLMVSSLTQEGAEVTVEALFEGAFDFIPKPIGGNREQLRAILVEKLESFRASKRQRERERPIPKVSAPRLANIGDLESIKRTAPLPGIPEDRAEASRQQHACPLIVIGSSTGGPQALRQVVSRMDLPQAVPILIVQHMPAGYTQSMAKRLNMLTSLRVAETSPGRAIQDADIWIAAGGSHWGFSGPLDRVRLLEDVSAPLHGCKPAVDYTLNAAAKFFGAGVLSVILTGMGRDGAEGCQAIRKAGGTVFAQDEATSAVFGMPKAVIEAGVVDRVLPLGRIAPAISRHLSRTLRSRV